MAINDVLLLKAARRDGIATLKCFWASDTRDLISMVRFTFSMRRHLIRLASAPFTSSHLATFGWIRFAVCTPGNEAECRIYEGWVRTPVLFQAVCGPKLTKFSDNVANTTYFPTPFSDCVTFLSESPAFYGSLLARFIVHHLANFG